jgi:type I restriction enzyme S subunit
VIKLGPEISNGIPCLRTSDVKPLRVETSAVKRISKEVSEQYRRTLLRGGEVLVNVRGTLGGVAVVDPALRDWNISREVALIPVAKVSSHFISLWIASLPCQNWLTGVTRGVAYTGINIEDLRMLPVALPSDAEQVEIVQRVEALFSLAERIESRLEETEKTVYDLIPSVLARAFRGELVPTEAELAKGDGRDYESASALLDRIWAERGPQTFGADAGDGGEAAGHRRPRRG